jgi:L-lactate dehydrogenase complex protein LldG
VLRSLAGSGESGFQAQAVRPAEAGPAQASAPSRRELARAFADAASCAGATCVIVDSLGRLRESLANLAFREAPRRVALAAYPLLDRINAGAVVQTAVPSCEILSPLGARAEGEFRAAVSAADWGLTGADLLVAETGTVVLVSAPGRERSISLLPDVHVVVASAKALVADLDEAMQGPVLSECGAAVLVTGPSRTADIEKVLVTGVHGPRRVIVYLLSEA